MTNAQTIGAAAVAVLAAAGGGVWYLRSAAVADAYAEAAVDCEAGRGDARLRTLDRQYGEDARPHALRVALSLCALGGSTDRYIDAKRAVDALNP
ncbi:MAG: hypothetical protein MUE52_04195 [Tabrizicola sp.]|nr:hypothetical protein [Tabrizicola sp.]